MTDTFTKQVEETKQKKEARLKAEEEAETARVELQTRTNEVADLQRPLKAVKDQRDALAREAQAGKEAAEAKLKAAVKAEKRRLTEKFLRHCVRDRVLVIKKYKKSGLYINAMVDFADEAYETAIGHVVGRHPNLAGLDVEGLHLNYQGPCNTRYVRKKRPDEEPLLEDLYKNVAEDKEGDGEDGAGGEGGGEDGAGGEGGGEDGAGGEDDGEEENVGGDEEEERAPASPGQT